MCSVQSLKFSKLSKNNYADTAQEEKNNIVSDVCANIKDIIHDEQYNPRTPKQRQTRAYDAVHHHAQLVEVVHRPEGPHDPDGLQNV